MAVLFEVIMEGERGTIFTSDKTIGNCWKTIRKLLGKVPTVGKLSENCQITVGKLSEKAPTVRKLSEMAPNCRPWISHSLTTCTMLYPANNYCIWYLHMWESIFPTIGAFSDSFLTVGAFSNSFPTVGAFSDSFPIVFQQLPIVLLEVKMDYKSAPLGFHR